MSTFFSLGAGIVLISCSVLAILLLASHRKERPENHPETQDDFAQSMDRWAHVQTERNK